MAALLRKAGHCAAVVETGHQAVTSIRDGENDVVLMDVCRCRTSTALRPRGRSVPCCRRKNRVPIIALTAHAMTGAEEGFIAAGMDDFVAKPIEPALLLGKLARLPVSA